MPFLNRPALAVTAMTVAAAAATFATPAMATTPTTHPTSLNARAVKADVAPNHHDTVVLTLRSGKTGLANEEMNFLVRSRRAVSGTHTWSTWSSVTATPGTTAGRYRIQITMTPSAHKGQKEQYQVKFTGDPTNKYAASRSQVFVVRAR